jgi:hypothetical protein
MIRLRAIGEFARGSGLIEQKNGTTGSGGRIYNWQIAK